MLVVLVGELLIVVGRFGGGFGCGFGFGGFCIVVGCWFFSGFGWCVVFGCCDGMFGYGWFCCGFVVGFGVGFGVSWFGGRFCCCGLGIFGGIFGGIFVGIFVIVFVDVFGFVCWIGFLGDV